MTTEHPAPVTQLSNTDLLAEVRRLAAHERRATVDLLAALAELDARRLYLGEGCSSLFTYCTQVLHLSEHAAYGRIEAARAARRFPHILQLLADGSINLTAVGLLSSHLTPENHRELLESARHKSKRDIEHIVAALSPQADVASRVRKLPAPKAREASPAQPVATTEQAPTQRPVPGPPRPVIVPLAPERYKVQFTVSRETYDKLRRAQDLMRHTIPTGDPATIFDRALTLLLDDLARTKLAAASRPRTPGQSKSESRNIPATVRREVWKRDGGRCAFVGTNGQCTETSFLEFHHVLPYADGGKAVVTNIELRCRAHNAYEAEHHFGSLFVRETSPMMFAKGGGLGPDRVRNRLVSRPAFGGRFRRLSRGTAWLEDPIVHVHLEGP
jgi:hypothetical protein